ncbi:SCO family protein [Leptospira sp. WS92.C1]
MKKQSRFKFISIILFGFLFAISDCGPSDPSREYDSSVTEFGIPKNSLPFYKGKDLQPVWLDTTESSSTKQLRRISPFRMTNQLGETIGDFSLKGNLSVISFFFTHCSGICPTITNNLKRVQETYFKDKQVRMFSFSVTPDLDTPWELKLYAEKRNIKKEFWHLLTGSKSEIYQMARESFNADTITPGEKKKGIGPNDFLHSESVYLLDQNLRVRGIYNGRNSVSIGELIADIKILQKE